VENTGLSGVPIWHLLFREREQRLSKENKMTKDDLNIIYKGIEGFLEGKGATKKVFTNLKRQLIGKLRSYSLLFNGKSIPAISSIEVEFPIKGIVVGNPVGMIESKGVPYIVTIETINDGDFEFYRLQVTGFGTLKRGVKDDIRDLYRGMLLRGKIPNTMKFVSSLSELLKDHD